MAIDGKPVALVALIHPKSVEKKNKVSQTPIDPSLLSFVFGCFA